MSVDKDIVGISLLPPYVGESGKGGAFGIVEREGFEPAGHGAVSIRLHAEEAY